MLAWGTDADAGESWGPDVSSENVRQLKEAAPPRSEITLFKVLVIA